MFSIVGSKLEGTDHERKGDRMKRASGLILMRGLWNSYMTYAKKTYAMQST